MPAAPHNPSLAPTTAARLIGLLIFLAGVGMLLFVFFTAKTLFDAPPPPVPTPAPTGTAGAAAPSALADLGVAFGRLLQRILILLLMCVAASVIASKGIQLFFAAGTPGLPQEAAGNE